MIWKESNECPVMVSIRDLWIFTSALVSTIRRIYLIRIFLLLRKHSSKEETSVLCFFLAFSWHFYSFFLLPPSPVLRSHAQARERRPLFSFRKGIQKASSRNASLCFAGCRNATRKDRGKESRRSRTFVTNTRIVHFF